MRHFWVIFNHFRHIYKIFFNKNNDHSFESSFFFCFYKAEFITFPPAVDIEDEFNPKFNKLGALLRSPIRCFCFRCSVIWSRRSANCEDSVLTNSCVASNWLWSVRHSVVSPSSSTWAKEMARRRGNQSKHFSWK